MTFRKMALVLALTLATPTWLAPASAVAQESATREIEIAVRGGYQPSRIVIREGERVRLLFVRSEYAGCTREVVIPALGIRRELPPGQPVAIELPADLRAGEYAFHCGMNMVRGTLVVEPR